MKIRLALTLATAFLILPAVASANEIALTLKDGSVTIRGDFKGFRKNAYIVATNQGEINVPANHVTCTGSDCLVIMSSNENN